MFKRSILIIGLLAVTLGACTPPETDVPEINLGSAGEQQSGSVEGLQTSPQYQLEGTMQQPGIKQLSDFEPIEGSTVTLTTSKGPVTIELYREQAPLTTLNFLSLVKSGFYNGIVIHRVEPNFVVQFGDPLTKQPGMEARWGTGDPGYKIADEFHPQLRHSEPGILSMANSGPNTGGSQVFITLAETAWLDDKHAVFGKVIQGLDIVQTLQVGDVIESAQYQ